MNKTRPAAIQKKCGLLLVLFDFVEGHSRILGPNTVAGFAVATIAVRVFGHQLTILGNRQ